MNQSKVWAIVILGIMVLGIGGYFLLPKKPSEPIVVQEIQGIVVEQPTANQEEKLPITVKGYINGNGWGAFEGVAGSVQVFDANGKAISEKTPLSATTDWMQPIVHFETTVGDRQMMSNLETQTGVLVFESENPKGDDSGKEFRVPIKFVGPVLENTFSKVSISVLDASPNSFLGKKVEITGRLILIGKNYYTDPRFAVTDGKNIFQVSAWVPLEFPPAVPGSLSVQPKTMQTYLDKNITLQGIIKQNNQGFFIEVAKAL